MQNAQQEQRTDEFSRVKSDLYASIPDDDSGHKGLCLAGISSCLLCQIRRKIANHEITNHEITNH
jgi:hypothetical protein